MGFRIMLFVDFVVVMILGGMVMFLVVSVLKLII